MFKLNDLVPLNLASEKEKFFQSNFKYNPQFNYAGEIKQKELLKYGKPKFWYLLLAKIIIWKYKKSSWFISENKAVDNFLNQEEIKKIIEERLAFYGLANSYQILFSTDFISRISVKNESKIVKIKLPILLKKTEIEGTLAHEIDTHVLRQLNYEKQTWYKKRKKFGLSSHLRTEEGLAAVNELVTSKHKLAYKSAINYLAVQLALKKDFISVFNFFYQFSGDSERSWIWAVKKKRGLKDTGQKGAFTKDVVYFEGFVEVLRYLRKNGGDPSKLYHGKISIKDLEKILPVSIHKPILPKIYTDDKDSYKKAIEEIIKKMLL